MMPLRIIVAPIVISLALATSGCAVTGPADDGFENSNESVDIGKLDSTGLLNLLKKKSSDSKNPSQ